MFERRRVETALLYREEFDKVFMAFILHGFVQEERLRIVQNAYQVLKPGGAFQTLDYAHFDPMRSGWLIRTIFARRDWEAILREHGFDRFEAHHYYMGYVRLLAAYKAQGHAG